MVGGPEADGNGRGGGNKVGVGGGGRCSGGRKSLKCDVCEKDDRGARTL